MCCCVTDDIGKDIADAKSAVEQANNKANNVSDSLVPLQKQLEEWQKQYGDSNASSDDINKALNDANASGACTYSMCMFLQVRLCCASLIWSFMRSDSDGPERHSSTADGETRPTAEHLISAIQHLRQHPEDPTTYRTGSQCC